MNDGVAQNNTMWSTVKEWTKTIIIALVIALPIRFFIAEPFIVSGESMDPTFAEKQFLIVDRLSYRFGMPDRGDIIIFEYPNNPKVYYIKRVIGLPGEKVSISDGKVLIDGLTLSEPYLDPARVKKDFFEEISLSPKQYFVMGDNRAKSADSRMWGALDEKFIIGRPILRLLPVNKISLFPGEHKTQ